MIDLPTSKDKEETTEFPTSSRQELARKWMSTIGIAEGISFLLLLLVAMPLKYVGQNPIFVHWLGPIHGGLFLLYLASAVAVTRILNWRWLHVLLAFIASVVPFGPFLFEVWQSRISKVDG
jgi:integral membrane protein